jgi:hypothetical protein
MSIDEFVDNIEKSELDVIVFNSSSKLEGKCKLSKKLKYNLSRNQLKRLIKKWLKTL